MMYEFVKMWKLECKMNKMLKNEYTSWNEYGSIFTTLSLNNRATFFLRNKLQTEISRIIHKYPNRNLSLKILNYLSQVVFVRIICRNSKLRWQTFDNKISLQIKIKEVRIPREWLNLSLQQKPSRIKQHNLGNHSNLLISNKITLSPTNFCYCSEVNLPFYKLFSNCGRNIFTNYTNWANTRTFIQNILLEFITIVICTRAKLFSHIYYMCSEFSN